MDEEGDHRVRRALELFPQLGVLRRDADRARVEVALAGHDAAQRDEGGGAEPKLLRAHERPHDDIPPVLEPAIHPQRHAVAQVVGDEHRLRLHQPQLPRQARVFDGRQGGRARPAVIAGNLHHIRELFHHARRNRAHPRLGHELHHHLRGAVDALQVVNQLRQVLDRVNVVVGRGGDERHPLLRVPVLGDLRVHLVPRDVPPLPGFAALRHFNLQLLRVDQVRGRHAEPGARDLLDAGVGVVALFRPPRLAVRHVLPVPVVHGVPARVLPALPRVGPRTHPVRRDGERLVRLPGDGAVRHGLGGKPADDRLHRFHRFQRDGGGGLDVVQGVPQRGERAEVHLLRKLGVVLKLGRLGRFPQLVEHVWVVRVELAPFHGGVRAEPGQGAAPLELDRLAVRGGVEREGVPPQLVKPDAGQAVHGVRKAAGDDVRPQPQRLKVLAAAVRVHRGDAHLGHDAEQAVLQRGAVRAQRALNRGVRLPARARGRVTPPGMLRVPHFGGRQLRHRLKREVRVDQRGTVRDQARDVVVLPRLPRLHNDARLHPLAFCDEVLVQPAHGEHHGERGAGGADAPV